MYISCGVYRKFHSQVLQFDGEGGWKLSVLSEQVRKYMYYYLNIRAYFSGSKIML